MYPFSNIKPKHKGRNVSSLEAVTLSSYFQKIPLSSLIIWLLVLRISLHLHHKEDGLYCYTTRQYGPIGHFLK